MQKRVGNEPVTASDVGAPGTGRVLGPGESTVVSHSNFYRKEIKAIAGGVKHFIETVKADARPNADIALAVVAGADRGEVIANLMLAYRHLEDASQRLGKAIQAADGGASVYDKDTTVGA